MEAILSPLLGTDHLRESRPPSHGRLSPAGNNSFITSTRGIQINGNDIASPPPLPGGLLVQSLVTPFGQTRQTPFAPFRLNQFSSISLITLAYHRHASPSLHFLFSAAHKLHIGPSPLISFSHRIFLCPLLEQFTALNLF